LAMVLVVSACGGGTGSPEPGAQEQTELPSASTAGGDGGSAGNGGGSGGNGSEADLEAAARALFAAFQARDDDAYFSLLSDACRSSAGFGMVSEANNSRHFNIDVANFDLSQVSVSDVQISDFDGANANVVLVLDGTEGNQFLENLPNPWVYEGGSWHWADCSPFEASGGGAGGLGGSGPDDPIGVGMVPTIADWYVYSSYLNPDATAEVTSEGVPAPPAGSVYFNWSVVVQYDGPNASEAVSDDLAFRLVAGDTTYGPDQACPGYFGEFDLDFVAAPGDQQPGSFCRAVATEDVGSLFLVVTDKTTGQDYWFGQS
jgi:hypothetical protein